jgi:hypothetical protein
MAIAVHDAAVNEAEDVMNGTSGLGGTEEDKGRSVWNPFDGEQLQGTESLSGESCSSEEEHDAGLEDE